MIDAEAAEEYTQSLGQIVGGSWRQILWAQQQGIPEALGLSTEDWVRTRLGGYIKLAVSDRREIHKQLTDSPEEGGEGLTQEQAAAVTGVSQQTVSNDVRPSKSTNFGSDLENAGENSNVMSPVSQEVTNFSSDLDEADQEDQDHFVHVDNDFDEPDQEDRDHFVHVDSDLDDFDDREPVVVPAASQFRKPDSEKYLEIASLAGDIRSSILRYGRAIENIRGQLSASLPENGLAGRNAVLDQLRNGRDALDLLISIFEGAGEDIDEAFIRLLGKE